MEVAIDPKTMLTCRPNPGARAVCPFCEGEMVAHCGAVLTWHWTHNGDSCQEWTQYADLVKNPRWVGERQSAQATCESCHWWRGSCRLSELSADGISSRWRKVWQVPNGANVPDVQEGAPQCPRWQKGPSFWACSACESWQDECRRLAWYGDETIRQWMRRWKVGDGPDDIHPDAPRCPKWGTMT
jgi:hypothetical protein